MENIYSLVYNTLLPLGYKVKEEGTFPPGKTLPETYITYFDVNSPNNSYADNKPTSQTTRIQVNLYSKDPALKQNADDLFRSVMLPAGFLRVGGRSLPFNKDTGHYCYTCDYRYYDQE